MWISSLIVGKPEAETEIRISPLKLAVFAAGGSLFGVRRSGTSEAAQSYPGEFVSGNYFAMFGINAYAGRMLTAADDRPNAPPVLVMSYRLWQQK